MPIPRRHRRYALDRQRPEEQFQNPTGNGFASSSPSVGSNTANLVAEAGDRVASALQRAMQAIGDFAEQHVAHMMTKCVVDELEPVQVEDHDRQAAAASFRGDHGLIDAIIEQRAVRQSVSASVYASWLIRCSSPRSLAHMVERARCDLRSRRSWSTTTRCR
jgi:hypothetical protein